MFRWIEGEPYDHVTDERDAAETLARFVRELRAIDATGAPRAGRAPLAELDVVTRPTQPAHATWERARGIALLQAAMIIPYYRGANPAFTALAERTVEQLTQA